MSTICLLVNAVHFHGLDNPETPARQSFKEDLNQPRGSLAVHQRRGYNSAGTQPNKMVTCLVPYIGKLEPMVACAGNQIGLQHEWNPRDVATTPVLQLVMISHHHDLGGGENK